MSDNQLLFLMITIPTSIVWWLMIRAENKQAEAFRLGYERGLVDGRAIRTRA
jgi:preprotein translocase subunit YajC